ncbi:general transcription factor 3C polypeptide 1 [Bufo gargarizans]|uniref:general transcription factor 3C polypeptide 1 n=1 Tax=Bufo gargarizans TaxID=30331 RepID=UPI001CF3B829|nr:general transcription factor 3C polypeptide 1 [Bufo gargarizans]
MDVLEAVLDEVALEGLDGITIPALWLRLQARVPSFPLVLDAATKQLIWQSLVCHPELQFYQLPKERRPLVLSNRYDGEDLDTGATKVKARSCEDIYPFHLIAEDKSGIKGSCQYFHQRILVTELLQAECITCEGAIDRWGEKLVIVGSQTLRYRALIGWEVDPSLELPDYPYCILEKIGRSRWQGEIQKDLQGTLKVDAGKVHYLRRMLDKNGLITMQTYVIRLPNGTQQHSLLLLLKRFHVDRRNKYDLLSERASQMLSERPDQTETLVNIREELGVPERFFKRLYHYMVNAGIVKIVSVPLHEIQPHAEQCKTKKGAYIMVRCMKLVKEYTKKEDDDEDIDEEDIKMSLPVDIIYEKDMLTQTYELIENRGTKGISQREIKVAMNVGKLEARMLCRLLERYMLIKGFMEDVGRQRTTKFISHVFVEESELRRQFLEEKAKSEKLSMLNLPPAPSIGDDKKASPESKASEEPQTSEDDQEELKSNKRPRTSEIFSLPSDGATTSTPLPTSKGLSRIHMRRTSSLDFDKMPLSENDCSMDSFQLESNVSAFSQQSADEDDDEVSVIEEVLDKEERKGKKSGKPGMLERSRETYRLLKRRNIIVEAVKNLRLVENLFTLQKMILEQEKQEGVPTRCCKKSIRRLVHRLSQEGLLRLYHTVVVQDGIRKKVEFVVHPSINPNDPLVKSAIEQIRFRISNSTSGNRTRSPLGQSAPDRADPDDQSKERPKGKLQSASLSDASYHPLKETDPMVVTQLKNYHPVTVPGLGRTLGYLPKMPRLKITHIFLWYIVYGHPSRKTQQQPRVMHNTITEHTAECENTVLPDSHPTDSPPPTQSTDVDPKTGSTADDAVQYVSDQGPEQCTETVYVDEESWMRYVPPAKVHSEYGPGWVLVSDILLCLPLSIFIQIVQVSYKVDNLEDYLNDPMKKHTLIRYLPRSIRQQLLYKRRYVFSVFQGLQKLNCMGLLQFAPSEKFKDKDQVFVYVKRNATIVDTTTCEPHYNIARANHPFDKRSYNLQSFQDVENFWFDLQFVCLNTPLGIVRYPRGKKANPQDESVLGPEMEAEQEDRQTLERKYNFLENSIPGSREVVDDGAIPGDGLGAGGLDSSFYSHLKRNWIWISYIINIRKDTTPQDGLTLRLQTFLNKHNLPLGSRGEQKKFFGDVSMSETGELVQMVKEATANRNKRVQGGRSQKRKRQKKETEKKPKSKKAKKETNEEKIKRNRYHDEADQSALQRMTRLRVAWTSQEDGLVMLCRIASNILNRKVKRPFVPWQVVRDIMHASMDESLDKTSHSIGRRARYIVKNPQTYLNYKVCLAEVYQDKGLCEEFLNRKGNYDDAKVCAAEFKEFVDRLKLKFSSALDAPAREIPDTVDELFNRFRVLAVGDESNQEPRLEIISSVDDIQVSALQNLMLSTLALSDMQMKSCLSLQTFRMYRQYSDNILGKAFLEFKEKRLVNRRRGNHTLGPKKNRALPFVPMSFQLSQGYYRLFTWRFPSTICTESFQFFEKLRSYGNADHVDTFSFGDQNNESPTDMLAFPLDGPGGQCVTVLSLLLLGFLSVNVKIPDQIVVVDSTLVENEVMKSLGKDGLDDEDFDDEDDDGLGTKRKIEVKARQASHTNYLLMRGYCAPGIVSSRNLNPNDNVVVNSCHVRLKLRHTPLIGRLLCFGSFSDFIADMPSLPPLFTELVNTKDGNFNIFINQCIKNHGYTPKDVRCVQEIFSAIKASSYLGIKVLDLGERFSKYEDVENGRTKSLQQYMQDLLTYKQVLQVGGVFVRLVATGHADPWVLHSYSVKEQDRALLGKDTDCSELAQQDSEEQADSDKSVNEPPKKKVLLEIVDSENSNDAEKMVVPVGPIVSDSESFTTKMDTGDSMGIHEKDSDCCFLGRPWRIVDGSLNKPVCKGMLEAVLYQVMTKPGITQHNLIQHYNEVLQPVVILELLQVLEHMGCIKKCYIENPVKASLFSKSGIPQLFKNGKLSEDLTVFYEPSIDCTLRLGGIFPSEVNWNKWVL